MDLNRVVVTWSGGGIVGQAVSVLHYAGDVGGPPLGGILTAYQQLGPIVPAGVTVTVPASGDVIDDRTGTITNVWNGTGGGVVNMNGLNTSAAGVGACVSLYTGGIVKGRKLRGRVFVVPLHTASYQSDGTLVSADLAKVLAFGNALMAAGPLAVWHRPSTKGATDGNSYGVQRVNVRDKVAVLRSRRD